MNYPLWVTDNRVLPDGVEDFIRKVAYVIFGCEKLKQLHNAMNLWARSESLTQAQQDLLAEHAPYSGTGYSFGSTLTDRPTVDEAWAWHDVWWKPRHDAAQEERAELRTQPTVIHFTYIDLQDVT